MDGKGIPMLPAPKWTAFFGAFLSIMMGRMCVVERRGVWRGEVEMEMGRWRSDLELDEVRLGDVEGWDATTTTRQQRASSEGGSGRYEGWLNRRVM